MNKEFYETPSVVVESYEEADIIVCSVGLEYGDNPTNG